MPGPKGESCVRCYYEEENFCRWMFPERHMVKSSDWCGMYEDYNKKMSEEEGEENDRD